MEDTRWWVLDYGSMSITSTQDESTSTEMIDDSIQHMYYEKQMPTQNSTFMFRAQQRNTIYDHSCRQIKLRLLCQPSSELRIKGEHSSSSKQRSASPPSQHRLPITMPKICSKNEDKKYPTLHSLLLNCYYYIEDIPTPLTLLPARCPKVRHSIYTEVC